MEERRWVGGFQTGPLVYVEVVICVCVGVFFGGGLGGRVLRDRRSLLLPPTTLLPKPPSSSRRQQAVGLRRQQESKWNDVGSGQACQP